MNKEPLKQAFETADYLSGMWVSLGSPTVAEVCAAEDFDFILIDTEHTTIPLETIEEMNRAIEGAPGDTGCVVRVPWNDPVYLKRALDIGIAGVMVPMIDTKEEAESLVDSLRYPPEGSRGIASGRAAGYGEQFREYVAHAEETFVTIAQIESKTGLNNVEAIAEVDGIDALFVGPADLSGALGVFGEWYADEFTNALERVIAAGEAAGIPVGILTVDRSDVADRVDRGFQYQIIGKDTTYLATENGKSLELYDQAIEDTHQRS